jgi:hypothetical protein
MGSTCATIFESYASGAPRRLYRICHFEPFVATLARRERARNLRFFGIRIPQPVQSMKDSYEGRGFAHFEASCKQNRNSDP